METSEYEEENFELKLADAKKKADLAVKALRREQYDKSLRLIEEAILLCPEKVKLKSKLHYIKGDIYLAQERTNSSLIGHIEHEKAFRMIPVDDEANKRYIRSLFINATMLFQNGKHQKAADFYVSILEEDENHAFARQALNILQRRFRIEPRIRRQA